MKQILFDYCITFGWAMVGAVSMSLAIFLALTVFTKLTKEVDEWQLIKENNLAMGIVLASVILSCAWVVSSVIRP